MSSIKRPFSLIDALESTTATIPSFALKIPVNDMMKTPYNCLKIWLYYNRKKNERQQEKVLATIAVEILLFW